MITISEVRINLNPNPSSSVLAFARCLLNESIVLDQLKVMIDKKTNQPCVRYPAEPFLDKTGAQKMDRKTGLPVWMRYYFPINKRVDLTIQTAILQEYSKLLHSKATK